MTAGAEAIVHQLSSLSEGRRALAFLPGSTAKGRAECIDQIARSLESVYSQALRALDGRFVVSLDQDLSPDEYRYLVVPEPLVHAKPKERWSSAVARFYFSEIAEYCCKVLNRDPSLLEFGEQGVSLWSSSGGPTIRLTSKGRTESVGSIALSSLHQAVFKSLQEPSSKSEEAWLNSIWKGFYAWQQGRDEWFDQGVAESVEANPLAQALVDCGRQFLQENDLPDEQIGNVLDLVGLALQRSRREEYD